MSNDILYVNESNNKIMEIKHFDCRKICSPTIISIIGFTDVYRKHMLDILISNIYNEYKYCIVVSNSSFINDEYNYTKNILNINECENIETIFENNENNILFVLDFENIKRNEIYSNQIIKALLSNGKKNGITTIILSKINKLQKEIISKIDYCIIQPEYINSVSCCKKIYKYYAKIFKDYKTFRNIYNTIGLERSMVVSLKFNKKTNCKSYCDYINININKKTKMILNDEIKFIQYV